MRNTYQLNRLPNRTYLNKKGEVRVYSRYTFTVPSEVGDLLYEAGKTMYTMELTEDGILYRPVSPAKPVSHPAWLGEPT